MFYRVKEVKPLPSYNVLVSFVTGECKRYNVAQLFEKLDVFKTLSSVNGLFEQVKVDTGGYGISWNDDIDLSCNELWENGMSIDAAPTDDLQEMQAAYDRKHTGRKEDSGVHQVAPNSELKEITILQ